MRKKKGSTGAKKGKRKHRKPKRGGALTDWIPGYNTAKSYVNSAYDAYNTGKNIYNTAKTAVEIYNKVKPKAPPPLLGGPPMTKQALADSKADILRNRKLDEARGGPPSSGIQSAGELNEFLKKHRFLGRTDEILKDLGLRDKVRGKLGQYSIGRHIINAADEGIQRGYGKPHRKKKTHRGKGRLDGFPKGHRSEVSMGLILT